jgi:hypothetical protein
MMADVPAAARQIAVPDEPAAWERLGFAMGEDGACALGDVALATRRERFEVAVDGLATAEPDGLALVPAAAPPDRRTPAGHAHAPPEGHTSRGHPNGALAVDHVVAFTDAMDRTLAALGAAGLELRRMREPPEAPARQAFLRLGPLILEVVETGTHGLWGLVVVVPDVEALGELVGMPREAVQPGRRIATVRREAGLSVALAFMTPRPQQPPPG